MAQYINKSAVVAEIKRYKHKADERLKIKGRTLAEDLKDSALQNLCGNLIHFLDTLEVKEVNIADMANDYYDALMEEESDWMDEGTMGHCRLAYYNGCKDVLNKLREGE